VTAVALTIAGSDPSGGAGIQADLKTFGALGVHGASVITALTAQNTRGVVAVQIVAPEFVTAQLDAVLSDIAVNAIKIGMLGNGPVIEAVAAVLDGHGAREIVLDPILHATSGEPLLDPGALDVLRRTLLPRSRLLTPNLAEAAALLGMAPADTESEMRAQAKRLCDLGPRAVLIKGGHSRGSESVDFLVDGNAELRLPGPRIATNNMHGTGCALSAAVAAGLAKSLPLDEAVVKAKFFVTAAISAADRLGVGSGRGPIHHLHAWW
jgi:hydroxymethylpyrimidine/phosphomethylpyrimidine kinase